MLHIRGIASSFQPATERRSCQHCGTPFSPRGDEAFCCAGCQSVNELIHNTGFDDYYARKTGLSAPVLDAPFVEMDWTWLEQRAKGSAQGDFGVTGLACEGCAWLAGQVVQRRPGVTLNGIDVAAKTISLSWTPGADLPALARELQRFGFILEPEAPGAERKPPSRIPLVFSAVFAANALLLQAPRLLEVEDFAVARLFDLLSLLFGALALVTLSHYAVRRRK